MSYIFKYKDGRCDNEYFWDDFIDEDLKGIVDYLYAVDDRECFAFHSCKRSALYDDMTGYVDALQNEDRLRGDELYVVTYYEYEPHYRGFETRVDFGITKQEIIDNVKAQKYIEGADYYTIGQMMLTTKNWLEHEANKDME